MPQPRQIQPGGGDPTSNTTPPLSVLCSRTETASLFSHDELGLGARVLDLAVVRAVPILAFDARSSDDRTSWCVSTTVWDERTDPVLPRSVPPATHVVGKGPRWTRLIS